MSQTFKVLVASETADQHTVRHIRERAIEELPADDVLVRATLLKTRAAANGAVMCIYRRADSRGARR